MTRQIYFTGLKSVFAWILFGILSTRGDVDNLAQAEIDANEPPKWVFTPRFSTLFGLTSSATCHTRTRILRARPLVSATKSCLWITLTLIVLNLLYLINCSNGDLCRDSVYDKFSMPWQANQLTLKRPRNGLPYLNDHQLNLLFLIYPFQLIIDIIKCFLRSLQYLNA